MTAVFPPKKDHDLDRRISAFLGANKCHWQDKNVPEVDGRILYDLILQNEYTHALEIGTSTGHSGIWIAWALSKTGGKLITVENDQSRHLQALANFKKSGISEFIDAHLADAHRLIPELDATFDFIFCDADKIGYKKYLQDVLPKLKPGGCFAAHNVTDTQMEGIQEFLDYLHSLPDLETDIDRSSGSGVSISFKR